MAKKKDTDLIESAIRGLMLVVEKGMKELKIHFPTLEKFYSLIRGYRKLEKREVRLKEEKQIIKEKLVGIITNTPGLKGLQTSDNVRTVIFRTEPEVDYNLGLLKESLGPAYEGVVSEDLMLTIMLTHDFPADELIKFLRKFFKNPETYKKMVEEEIVPRVDEEKLKTLVDSGRVTLKEGTKIEKKKATWNIKTTTIKE